MARPKKITSKKENEFDFEQGLERLESIVSKFDEGGMNLDEMEKFFIEGIDLVKKCNDRLDNVESRITKLIDDQDSEITEEPFDESEIS
jgi:exodeoxyribonuclease VII small subunit